LRVQFPEPVSAQKYLKVTCPKCRTQFIWDPVRRTVLNS
jgi:hypothetical protein